MSEFIIENDFWELFPNVKIGAIVVRGLNNHIKREDAYAPLLRNAEAAAKAHFPEEDFSANPAVAVWRDAFRLFKTKKGARSSVEAMLKRVANGGQIGCINPLVDIYNSVCLTYGLPVGGEDMDKMAGNLLLTIADGTEPFLALGSEKSEPPYPGEVVYKDDAGAVCRCFNWREAVRTMLTEDTSNAFLCIELAEPSREAALKEAVAALEALVTRELGGSTAVHFLSRENPVIALY